MATPTTAEIKARYPALASIPDATVNAAIADAVPWFDEARWGAFYSQGFAAFVAHMLVQDQAAAKGQAGASGPVSKKKVGDVEVDYSTPTAAKAQDALFMTTVYGQRYLQLRRMVGTGAIAV